MGDSRGLCIGHPSKETGGKDQALSWEPPCFGTGAGMVELTTQVPGNRIVTVKYTLFFIDTQDGCIF